MPTYVLNFASQDMNSALQIIQNAHSLLSCYSKKLRFKTFGVNQFRFHFCFCAGLAVFVQPHLCIRAGKTLWRNCDFTYDVTSQYARRQHIGTWLVNGDSYVGIKHWRSKGTHSHTHSHTPANLWKLPNASYGIISQSSTLNTVLKEHC